MFVRRPYDGIVVDPDRRDLTVQAVLPNSGAAAAGIRPGDRIVGLGREVVRTPSQAARALQRQRIGDQVPYLVQRGDDLIELDVTLGPRRLGTALYLYAAFLGFFFFFVGLFVLMSRRGAANGSPARVFFVLCTLFMLFLVCRLRPASYTWADNVVLTTGTLSLLALPAAFLHFFLVFPRRLRISLGAEGSRPGLAAAERLLNSSRLITVLYLLPPLLYAGSLAVGAMFGVRLRLVSGAPLPSWVLMGDYLILGLLALFGSMLHAQEGKERRQIATVFGGTVLGVTPFLVLGVLFPSLLQEDRYLLLGVVPLILVPLTFGYAIVRFHVFDIRVIVRRSLFYTLTTAVVAVTYAIGIAAFNLLFRDVSLGRSPYYPVLLALAILALFDPLRRRLQEPIDRFFFREAYDARRAVEEMSEAIVREVSEEGVEDMLTGRLCQVMHVEWAVLFLPAEGLLEPGDSAAVELPPLPRDLMMVRELIRRRGPQRVVALEPLKVLDRATASALDALAGAGARLLVPLLARDHFYGLLVFGPKLSEEEYHREDLQLVKTLANQAAVALENARLLRDRTRQVALEKELEIARRVQFSLIPDRLPVPPGWQVSAHCAPAQQVGGDFYDALPGAGDGEVAVVLGDVSGKSVAGAMRMVAAREVLHTAALGGTAAEVLLATANRRLYNPQPRLFVALAYMLLREEGRVSYALAGQPAPLLRRRGGVVELPAPRHRLPLGALRDGAWDLVGVDLEAGDTLLLYSDGVTEAQDASGESFGDDRLRAALERCDGETESVVAEILATLRRYTQGAEPYDDLTLVALRWTGGAGGRAT